MESPKRSKVKNDYLSNAVYTKSNNQINQFKTYILQVISKIINLSKNKIKNFLNKYPAFQYKFNMHREQLFIYQLAFLINQNQYSKVIEIGSSDLSEYITLKSCFKNASFSHFIYEGLEETFELITEKVLKIIIKIFLFIINLSLQRRVNIT